MTDFDSEPGATARQQGLLNATSLTDEDRWDEAFGLLCELEREYPGDAALLCALGTVASETDARGEAYDFFRRGLAAGPEDPHVLVILGTGLARYDDPEAETVLRLAAVTAPGLAAARLSYGTYLVREGIFELGIAELHAAQSLDPDDAAPVRELGIAYLLSGESERGADQLEAASAMLPDDARTRFLYALALMSLNRLPEAAEEAHRAAADLPEDGEMQALAALACATQGWWNEAWDALARAEEAPVPPDSQLLREVEEAVENDDQAAAERLLVDEAAPTLLRARLLERP